MDCGNKTWILYWREKHWGNLQKKCHSLFFDEEKFPSQLGGEFPNGKFQLE